MTALELTVIHTETSNQEIDVQHYGLTVVGDLLSMKTSKQQELFLPFLTEIFILRDGENILKKTEKHTPFNIFCVHI